MSALPRQNLDFDAGFLYGLKLLVMATFIAEYQKREVQV